MTVPDRFLACGGYIDRLMKISLTGTAFPGVNQRCLITLAQYISQGYTISQRKRPLIEKAFGWMKQTGGMRKTRFRGLLKVSWQFLMTAAAFNLWRLPKLNAVQSAAQLATT